MDDLEAMETIEGNGLRIENEFENPPQEDIHTFASMLQFQLFLPVEFSRQEHHVFLRDKALIMILKSWTKNLRKNEPEIL